ncbi:hypothetical protein [Nocardia arizonensis]|uniref:hypothetical protein n=1 Tax=Nocardia arizonensis TaxID=1141647 RepID=UPI0006D0C2AB|nr:hypothetical protein [Nocardia arizonensis]
MPKFYRTLAMAGIATAAVSFAAHTAIAEPSAEPTPGPATSSVAPTTEPAPATTTPSTSPSATSTPATPTTVAPSATPTETTPTETTVPEPTSVAPGEPTPAPAPSETAPGDPATRVACMFEDASVEVFASEADAQKAAEGKKVAILACAPHPIEEHN